MAGVIIALDHPSRDEAMALVDRLGDPADFYKVGFELYVRAGSAVVEELRRRGKRVFLDLKFHDIPNTVSGAVRAAVDLDVEFLTVHAAGGSEMIRAAREAAADRARILAVTVLTSLSPSDVVSVWGRPIQSLRDEVVRLARLAVDAGADGVVASAMEAAWLRRALGRDALLVTPGIRTSGEHGDQKRVATPTDAVEAGSDYLVVGRAVTNAPDPSAALEALLAELATAQADA
ncbi:MAG: orotidine-5'-phosphate decarboxylase [Longimicrobiales bacterium]